MINDLGRDLWLAWRSLRRSPGLLAVSVVSLGIGIGVNTTLFSALTAVLLYQPTVTDTEHRVWLQPGNSNQFSFLNLRDLQERPLFRDAVGYRFVPLAFQSGDRVERTSGIAVTSNFFEDLGITAAIGRVFTAAEAVPERNPHLAVLGDSFWRRRLNADPSIVGRYLTLNGQPYLVVGVLPVTYRPPAAGPTPGVYVPLSRFVLPTLLDRNNGNALAAIGHLPAGMTREQAQALLTSADQDLERTYPRENEGMGRRAVVLPLSGLAAAATPEALIVPLMLTALFWLVLLIACGNVAGLLFARAAGRRRELALRSALGASRARLIRTLLAESTLLAVLGAVAGFVLTLWLMPMLSVLTISGVGEISLNLAPGIALYGYALTLILVTGVVCGLVPALKATRANVATEIQQGSGRGITEHLRLRHLFVVGQVTAAVTLLAIASLFLRSVARAAALDPGFDLGRGALARIDLGPTRFSRDAAVLFAGQVLERVRAVPGIQAASVADIVPLGGDSSRSRFRIEGRPNGAGQLAYINSVDVDYFETMGISLVRGRSFRTTDRAGAPPVVVISRAFANAAFPGQDAVGQRVDIGASAEVVGVVENSNYQLIGEAPEPLLYYAFAQRPVSTQARPLTVHVRTSGDPTALLQPLKRAIADVDPAAVVDVDTLRHATVTNTESQMRRMATTLLASLGVLGLFLASLGLYGVMAHMVTSRTSDIGIRMALGASAGRVRRDVLTNGLQLVAYGLAIGTVISLVLARAASALLAGLSPTDPIAFGGTALMFLAVGLCAMYFPARRATEIDPLVALRHD